MHSKRFLEHCTRGLGPIVLGGALSAACSGAGPEPEPGAPLRAAFPEQAEQVLGAPGEFASTEGGFTSVAHAVSASLPREGEGAVRLRLADGWEVRVREHGAHGLGTRAEHAVSFHRAGGTSYWTAMPGAVEEWLHLEAGTAARGGVVASWTVDGARLEQRGAAVGLFDQAGRARLWVTTPAAYTSGGKEIGVRLALHGTTIDVSVDPTPGEVLVDPGWITTAPMSQSRSEHRQVLLGNGTAFAIGGGWSSTTLASTEAYDVYTNTWTTKASMATARTLHTATVLGDRRVLVVGGTDVNETSAYGSTEIYDPSSDTWSAGASLGTARYLHQAVLLGDGRVLVAGGQDSSAGRLATAEVYDPSTDTWSSAGSMSSARIYFAGTVLADGRAMFMGGFDLVGSYSSPTSADIYDPSTSTWTAAATMHRSRYYLAAALLQDGRIMAGGGDMGAYYGTSELYDPVGNTWTLTGNMQGQRLFNTTAVLGDGRVLLVGEDYEYSLKTSELYDPSTNSWSDDNMLAYRTDSPSTLLPDGEVLVSGGDIATVSTERYSPVAANGTSCTTVGQCSSGYCVDGVCCNTSCGGGSTTDCQVCTAALGGTVDGACTTIYTGSCALSNGASCTSSSQCGSGYCVDGVCCNTACGGGVTTDCQACSVTAGGTSNGTCSTITTGPTCGASNGTSCTATNQCQSGYCVDGVCCNTSCGGGVTTDCQACSVSAGAPSNGTCATLTTGSTCGASNGTSCTTNSQCQSGYCVDGVCCNTSCGGGVTTDCQACSVSAGAPSNGTCATLTTGSCAAPTCITIQRGTSGTVADAHIVNTAATTNYGANGVLSTGSTGTGNTRYALIRFDLSAIPSTATITQATLTLQVFSNGGATENAHRITASWSESTVTWNSFAGAFDSSVALSMAASTTYTGDLSSLVQAWVNGTYSNYGILLERDLTAATSFDASEYPTVADRPMLYVCYH